MAFAAPAIDRIPVFVRFLACGGVAALANWGSRFLWSLILPFSLAVVAAYAVGMVVAFYLFRAFVFDSARPIGGQARDFCLVNLFGMAATVCVAWLLVEMLFPAIGMTFHAEAIGHAIAIATPVATSWVGHRIITFR